MGRVGVWLFALSCVLYAMAVAWAWIALPEGPIPSHWSTLGPGPADGWSSRGGTLGFMVGMGIFVGGIFAAIMAIFMTSKLFPGLNIPNKDYWTRPENIDETRRRSLTDMGTFGAATMLLLIDMVVMTVFAARTPNGQSPPWSGVAFGVFMAYAIWFTIWTATKRWKIPPEGTLHV
ncbi:MAG: hypothetical protein Q4G51_12100 [Dermatophilus congolensis]|nr:hypothetical protein [Dermatophilus congolensis]